MDGGVWPGEEGKGLGGKGGKAAKGLSGPPASCPAMDAPVSWPVDRTGNAGRFKGLPASFLTFHSASAPLVGLAPVLPGDGARAPWRDALLPGAPFASPFTAGGVRSAAGLGGEACPPGGGLAP